MSLYQPLRILVMSALAALWAVGAMGCDQLQGGSDQDQAEEATVSGAAAAQEVDQPGEMPNADGQFADGRRPAGTPEPTRPSEPQFRNPGDSRGDSIAIADNETSDWAERQAERRERANERRRRNQGSVTIGDEPQRQRIPHTVAGELSDRQLNRFAQAVESVAEVYTDDNFERRMMAASSYDEVLAIQAGIEDEIRQRIERSGLSYEEYMGLSQRLEREPELQRRLAELVGTPSQTQYMQGSN